jgi:hypothetical protein
MSAQEVWVSLPTKPIPASRTRPAIDYKLLTYSRHIIKSIIIFRQLINDPNVPRILACPVRTLALHPLTGQAGSGTVPISTMALGPVVQQRRLRRLVGSGRLASTTTHSPKARRVGRRISETGSTGRAVVPNADPYAQNVTFFTTSSKPCDSIGMLHIWHAYLATMRQRE